MFVRACFNVTRRDVLCVMNSRKRRGCAGMTLLLLVRNNLGN
jgi:hypothetical protein